MRSADRYALVSAGLLTFAGGIWAFLLLPDCGVLPAILMSLLLTAALIAALLPLRGPDHRWFLPCSVLAAMLLVLRILPFGKETTDFTWFLQPWTETMRTGGHFRALGREIGNYNVPYLTLLALFSCWEVPELYLIKLTSVLSDILLAFCASALVREAGGSRMRSTFAFVLVLALPTVFLNGAVWGQCDSIYVSLGLLGLLLCLREKPVRGMLALAFSFAFKLQAVFLLPTVLLLLFARKVKWYHLPVFPAGYLLAVSPALLAGRGFWDTVLIYVNTASTAGSSLNYNSPSMYSLLYFYRLAESELDAAGKAGILAAFCFCLVVFLLFFLRRKQITDRSLVLAALLFTLALPLLLPHMHERYFYFCDILTVVFACLCPPAALTILCSQFASLLGYHAYFFMRYLLPMRYGFFALVFVLLFGAAFCVRLLFSRNDPIPPDGMLS